MLYDRRKTIEELLNKNGTVYYKELEALFPDVSTMTLRRDIEWLILEGSAVKINNGARSSKLESEANRETVYGRREQENVEVKINLACAALNFVEPERSIYLDAGTTIIELARLLTDVKLSILTSCPNIALESIKKHSHHVNIVGGTINRDNCAISGPQALAFIKEVNIDTAFLVPSGYSDNSGFTCGNYSECEVKKSVIKKANRIVMLCASYKLDKALPYTFATLKDVDYLITDGKPEIFKVKKNTKTEIIKV